MPNAATSLVIGGFATGLGLATLVALPGATPKHPVAALPERPAPAPDPKLAPGPEREAREITLAELDAIAREPGEAAAALRPVRSPRD